MDDDSSQVNQLVSKYKLPIALSVVGGVLLVGGLFSSNLISKPNLVKSTTYPPESLVQKSAISTKVDVSGAVLKPGVYTLASDSRVEDAIKAAGGILETADPNYLSKSLNLAQKITDGMKIYIPQVGENASLNINGVVAGVSASDSQAVININQASQGQLESLPGVGAVIPPVRLLIKGPF